MPIIMIPKEQEDELMHYGVLGMKWGVRKGRTTQQYNDEYKKASKKLAKIDAKYTKKERKNFKKQTKADRKINSPFASAKTKQKAMKRLQKSRRKTYKAARKGHRWVSRMEKSFSEVNISLTASDRELGKKYIEVMRLHALR